MLRNHQGLASLVIAACVVSMGAVGVSSAAAQPTKGYAVFAQCPTGSEEVRSCIVARTESGEIKLGKQGVPIVNTQTLQGGLINHGPYVKEFAAAVNGETLTKTPQKVPGGLLGLVKCNEITSSGLLEKLERKTCEAIFENKLTGVSATTELAVPANEIELNEIALETGSGTALGLPVKVKLENPLLGSNCYIGSSAEPIKLELTSGTSGALTGFPGVTSTKEEGGILVISGNKLVDSGFAAPAATGCGPGGLLDGLINKKIGLPATTGNTAVLNNTLEQANAELVKASE